MCISTTSNDICNIAFSPFKRAVIKVELVQQRKKEKKGNGKLTNGRHEERR
jgi:hypothetical protein